MIAHTCESELLDFFRRDSSGKKNMYVKMNETAVCDSSAILHVDLGSCISCVMAGLDDEGMMWLAANHLFKSRDQNDDLSLFHIAALHGSLTEKGIGNITCLGLFGGGYNENSPAGKVARKNVLSSLESISIFNLCVELFETGYRQSLSLYSSDSRKAVLLRHKNITTGSVTIYEFPYAQWF